MCWDWSCLSRLDRQPRSVAQPVAFESASPDSVLSLTVTRFLDHSVSLLILYASIMAIGYVLDSRERLAVQETERAHLNELLTRAQLDALRRQIEPHFLFNTLNNVAALIREERNNAAVETIAGLGHLLRRVVECPDRHEVALGEEMEFLEKYLDIQKLRFAERLRLSVDVPKELFAAQVPSLLLQPIVENSIKHGIAKSAQGGPSSHRCVSFRPGADAQRLQRRADTRAEPRNVFRRHRDLQYPNPAAQPLRKCIQSDDAE